ncbi:retinoblastoma-associated protein-like [Glandiceps talaboti]
MAASTISRESPRRHSANGQDGSRSPQLENNMAGLRDDLALQEKQFTSLLEKINIPRDVSGKALELWLNILHTGRQEYQSDSQAWISCCVFIAALEIKFLQNAEKKDKKTPEKPCITLSHILSTGDMNIVVFCKKMRSLRNDVPISESVINHLITIERKFIVVAPLYNKFEKIYNTVFQDEQDEFNNGARSNNHVSRRKKTCWSLFVLAKSLMLPNCNELVLPFQLLLCCIDHAIRMSPTFLLKPPYSKYTAQSNHYATSVVTESNSNSLRLLCEESNCDHSDVITVLREYWQKFLQSIPTEKLHQGIDGLPELNFLLEQYQEVHHVLGDFDEILFLDHDPHLMPTINRSSSDVNVPVSSTSSRQREAVPPTPIRAAMNTVQALQAMLNQANDIPTPGLVRYFTNCPVNPSSEIEKRIVKLQQDFIARFLSASGPQYREIAKKRWQLALRLYYRVMEAMLKSEEERLSMTDFSTLLHNDTFHKSLLAASVEVVMVTYGATWNSALSIDSEITFPGILNVFCLKGFDFYKVLESFVKAEPKLTRDVIKHLQTIESHILECIAWQSDSPLFKFDAVKLATVAATSKIQDNPAGNMSPSTTTAADMYLSPLKIRSQMRTPPHTRPTSSSSSSRDSSPLQGPTTSTSNSGVHTSQYAASETQNSTTVPRSQTLNLFFNKVLKLAYVRLQALCRELRVENELERYIWTTVEYCVINRPELLKDRHMDQIILCCIYGVSKAADNELRFKDIVASYRRLYHSSQFVYKSVLIEGREHDSIIGFYNRVFMPAMKIFILRFQPNRLKPMLSPIPTKCQTGLTSPTVISVPGRSNFYVSPMKESPFKSPRPKCEFTSPSQMTPRSRTLYSFGEGPGVSEKKLQKINEAMRAVKRSTESSTALKSQKRLKFNDPEENTEQEQQHNNNLSTTTNGVNHKGTQSGLQMSTSNNNNGTTHVLQRKLNIIASERRSVKANGKASKR